MKHTFKINPAARIMHVPKELVEAGFSNDVQGYTNACTLTIIRPGATFDEVKRGLAIVLEEYRLSLGVASSQTG